MQEIPLQKGKCVTSFSNVISCNMPTVLRATITLCTPEKEKECCQFTYTMTLIVTCTANWELLKCRNVLVLESMNCSNSEDCGMTCHMT